MKSFLSLVLALLCVVASASTHQHLRARHPASAPHKTEIVVPWKTVAAGGAAAGTVIAAYKVSDGIEDGIKTVAKEKPEVITESLSVLTWPLRWGALILFILIYCEVLRRFICKNTTSTKKDSKSWKLR
jgi:hypothetical protein